MVKQKLTLSIDKKIITQAKKQQINLSSFLEIRLIDYLSDKENCSRREGDCNLLVKNKRDVVMVSATISILKTYVDDFQES
jgi:predicted DNA-binding ribbon-helix-helix protein